MKSCVICQKPVESNRNKLYCSRTCKMAAYLSRKGIYPKEEKSIYPSNGYIPVDESTSIYPNAMTIDALVDIINDLLVDDPDRLKDVSSFADGLVILFDDPRQARWVGKWILEAKEISN